MGTGEPWAQWDQVGLQLLCFSIFFLHDRPRWFPTMTRTVHMLSPMCPKSLDYTRYLPVGPSALPSFSFMAVTKCTLSAHTPPLPSAPAIHLLPSLALFCPSIPSQNWAVLEANL